MSFTPIAKKVALQKMRKVLESKIEKQGLAWEDLVMAMDAVSMDDLKAAAADPEKILTTLMSFTPIAKKVALNKLRGSLQPKIEKQGLVWEDIVTAVESVTLDDLKAAGADADKILAMLTSFMPIAKKVALHKLRGVLEPKIEKQGLVWADLVTTVESVTLDDLKAAGADADKILAMLTSFTPIAKKVALHKL